MGKLVAYDENTNEIFTIQVNGKTYKTVFEFEQCKITVKNLSAGGIVQMLAGFKILGEL